VKSMHSQCPRYCQILWMSISGVRSSFRLLVSDYAASAGCSIPSLNLMPLRILAMN
jgi:hypothetical protein